MVSTFYVSKEGKCKREAMNINKIKVKKSSAQ